MNITTETDPYYFYMTLHLLEVHRPDLMQFLSCDEMWQRGKEVYEKWEQSEYNDDTRSHYDCIEEYVQYVQTL